MSEAEIKDIIVAKIRARYSVPERVAYLYMFLLKPDAKREGLIPPADEVVQAWVDEGQGLTSSRIDNAIEKAQLASTFHPARPKSSQERRLAMARIVTLTVKRQADDQYLVDLFSRALASAPKGDRRALETWRPAEGSWYSAPVDRE